VYTQCPECRRQFRIRADQLRVAAGEVKCGYCGEQFNALQNLRDQPLPPEKIATAANVSGRTAYSTAPAPGQDLPEPEFRLPPEAMDDSPGPVLPDESSIGTDTASADNGMEFLPAAAEAAATDNEPLLTTGMDTGFDEADKSAAVTASPPDPDQPVAARYDFPDTYLKDETPAPGRRNRILWGLGCVLLMIVLVTQATWYHRDRVLARYPQFIPAVQQFCGHLGCRVTRFRETNGIRLVNRDVREHPRYVDSLLVNATMINHSANVQPWPLIRLSLFDTHGNIISYRDFLPGEYLDDSIDRSAGMSVNAPVHFVLEVTGPTEGAVSFEFDFLHGQG